MRKWIHRLTNKNFIDKTALCSHCGFVGLKVRGKKRLSIQCKNAYNACRRKISLNLLPKPKICPICLKDKVLVIDHKHGEKIMRGWICQKCNSLIGWLYEDTEYLSRMANYINNFNSEIAQSVEQMAVNHKVVGSSPTL